MFREEYGTILARLVRASDGDIEAAEAALSDALAAALAAWSKAPPERPGAWVTTVGLRRLVDRARRAPTAALEAEPAAPAPSESDPEATMVIPREEFPHEDERLRLLFTCCHPALDRDAQVALTLNTLSGLRASEIARAFLTRDVTMSQRLVRAKRKIRDARIPYRVPGEDVLAERLEAVLRVVYLVFNEGYGATSGDRLVRRDLCDEAVGLARVLCELLPSEDEPRGLLALLLLQDSRRDARVDEAGELVLLEDQDRSLWDSAKVAEGLALLARDPAGPYALQAAIAGEHARAARPEDTDHERVVALYERLLAHQPSPVVALNYAVAVAMARGPAAGWVLVEGLAADESLERYLYLHAARADLLRRMGRRAEAREAYRRALELADNALERRFLARRLAEVG